MESDTQFRNILFNLLYIYNIYLKHVDPNIGSFLFRSHRPGWSRSIAMHVFVRQLAFLQ